jgi:hypothetical protein
MFEGGASGIAKQVDVEDQLLLRTNELRDNDDFVTVTALLSPPLSSTCNSSVAIRTEVW